MESRVNGAFGQIECSSAAASQLLDNEITMSRVGLEGGKYEKVEMTFE
jgi:hypothetical protein